MHRLRAFPAFIFTLCALAMLLPAQDVPTGAHEGWLETPLVRRLRNVDTAQQAREALIAVQAGARRVALLLQGGTSDQGSLQALVQVLEHQRSALLDIERVSDESQRLPARRVTLDVQIGDARDAVRLQRASHEGQREREREFIASVTSVFEGIDADALAIRRRESSGEITAVQALITVASDEEGTRRERVTTLAQAMTGRLDRVESLRSQLAVARSTQAALERACVAVETAGETGAALWLPRERQYSGELEILRIEASLLQVDTAVLEVRAMEIELAQLNQDEAEARKEALFARLSAIEIEQRSCLQAEDQALAAAANALRAEAATDPVKAMALQALEVRREQLGLERSLGEVRQMSASGVLFTAGVSIHALALRVESAHAGDARALPSDFDSIYALEARAAAEHKTIVALTEELAQHAESLVKLAALRERDLEQSRAAQLRSAAVASASGGAELNGALLAQKQVIDSLEAALGKARETAHALSLSAERNLRHVRTRLLWTRRGGSLGFGTLQQAWNDADGLAGFAHSSLQAEATSWWQAASDSQNLRSTILVLAALFVMIVGSLLIRRWLPQTFSWMEAHQHGDSGRLWRLLATFVRRTNLVFLLALGWCAVNFAQSRNPLHGMGAVLLLTPFCWLGLRCAASLLLARNSSADRVLRIDNDFAGALQTTVNRLLLFSVLLVPAGLLLEEGGYVQRNPGFLELWWFAYSLGFLALLLIGFLRPGLLSGWMRARGVVTDSVRAGLIMGWPLVLVSILGLLALYMLRYEAAAKHLQGALLEAAAILAIAISVYHLAFGRFLRELHTEALKRDSFESEQEFAQAATRRAAALAGRASVRLLLFGPATVLLWRLGSRVLEESVPERITTGGEWQLGVSILRGLLVAGVGIVLLQHVSRLMRYVVLPRTHLDTGVQYALATLVTYLLVAALVVVVLRNFSVEGAQIAWALTALSVGIGFGLQDLVRGSVAGLVLLVQRPVRVGDHVSVGAQSGTVEEITLRSTTIRTVDNATVIVPNQNLMSEMITDRVAVGELARFRVRIGVSYATNIGRARTLVREVLATHSVIKTRPVPEMLVIDAGDSAVILEVCFWVAGAEQSVRIQAEVREALLESFQANGIDIPFPQMEVRMRGSGPLNA